MKKLLVILAAAAFLMPTNAQNPYKIKEFILKTQQYKEIEPDVMKGFENPKMQAKPQNMALLHFALGEIKLNAYFNPELTKAAQGVPFDTLAFCRNLDEAVTAYLQSYELDAKGEFKTHVHGRLMQMLDYYNYAGVFANANHDIEASTMYFQKYLDLPKCPVFTQEERDDIYDKKKTAYDQTHFNLAMLYYNSKQWDKVISAVDECLNGEENLRDLYIMKQAACLEMGDSAAWYATMNDAILRTGNINFQQTLLYDYLTKHKYDEARAMGNELVQKAPEKSMAWYMKGCIDMNVDKNYDEARKSFNKALEINPDFVEACVNMGNSYINECYGIMQSGKYKYIGTGRNVTGKGEAEYKKEKAIYDAELAEVRAYYENARPFMEKAKALAPDQPKLWAASLQMIYQNLGDEQKAKDMQPYIDAANAR